MAAVLSFASCSNIAALVCVCSTKQQQPPPHDSGLHSSQRFITYRARGHTDRHLKGLVCDVFEVDDDIVICTENSHLQSFSCHLKPHTHTHTEFFKGYVWNSSTEKRKRTENLINSSVCSHLRIRFAGDVSINDHFLEKWPEDTDPLSQGERDAHCSLQTLLHCGLSPDRQTSGLSLEKGWKAVQQHRVLLQTKHHIQHVLKLSSSCNLNSLPTKKNTNQKISEGNKKLEDLFVFLRPCGTRAALKYFRLPTLTLLHCKGKYCIITPLHLSRSFSYLLLCRLHFVVELEPM